MVFDSKAYDELFPREKTTAVQTNADDSMLNNFRTETKEKVGEEDGLSGTDESNIE